MGAEAENTIMDDLAEAWDASEGEDNAETGQADEVHQPDPEPDSGTGESDSGREGAEPDGVHEGAVRQSGEHVHEADKRSEEDAGPPVGLPPAAREAWKDAPQAIKDHIQGIEKRMEGMAQKYGRDAQRAQQMDRVLQPFGQLFAMNGGPQNVMPGLLQTASILQMGSGPQKAEQVAQIIKQFGVDIKTLDNLLVGKGAPPEMQQQTDIQQAVNQAVAPYQQALQGIQQQQQMAHQQSQQQVTSEVDTFARDPQNEFYHDVKMDMADILDMAANRGIEMDLKTAYDRACAMNPEISKILQTRGNAQDVQNKRRAASSVHGTLGGEGDANGPQGLRAALADAWENSGRV